MNLWGLSPVLSVELSESTVMYNKNISSITNKYTYLVFVNKFEETPQNGQITKMGVG